MLGGQSIEHESCGRVENLALDQLVHPESNEKSRARVAEMRVGTIGVPEILQGAAGQLAARRLKQTEAR